MLYYTLLHCTGLHFKNITFQRFSSGFSSTTACLASNGRFRADIPGTVIIDEASLRWEPLDTFYSDLRSEDYKSHGEFSFEVGGLDPFPRRLSLSSMLFLMNVLRVGRFWSVWAGLVPIRVTHS